MNMQTATNKPSGVSARESARVALANRRRPVRVLLFSDHRQSERRAPFRASEIASNYGKRQLPIDRVVITRVFISALQRAGWDTSPEPAGFAVEPGVVPAPLLVEGHIWQLRFQIQPTPTLDLDLSLALYEPQSPVVLWTMDFPADATLPFWIGLGCREEHMVPAALAELETAALHQFRSTPFLSAVAGRVSAEHRLPTYDPEGSHKVVAATSWTTSEQGQITATAHESVAAENGRAIPGAASSPPTPSQGPKPKQQSTAAVETH